MANDPRSDAELLAATEFEPEVFGTFYRRHTATAYRRHPARRPARRAGPLPPTPGLSARRIGTGWIAVYGGDAMLRLRLLARLHPRL